VYEVGTIGVAARPVGESTKVPVDPSPPAVNTRGATPKRIRARPRCWTRASPRIWTKDDVETEKPKKPKLPLQTGGAFKIYEPKASCSPSIALATQADEEEFDREESRLRCCLEWPECLSW
jgi:hypothetical protein